MATFIQSGVFQNRGGGGRFASGKNISLTVDVSRVLRGYALLGRGIANREPYNRKLSVQLLAWVRRNFASGGADQTPTWAPLKESTRREKERKGYSTLPLTRTGELRQSFYPVADNNQGGVRSDSDYGRYHQTGTKHMPQRLMLPPEEYVRQAAIQIYSMHVVDSITKAGLK